MKTNGKNGRASRSLGLAAILACWCSSTALAQTNEIPSKQVILEIDSGVAYNPGDQPQTVIGFHVYSEGAGWMRLYFSDVELSGNVAAGTGSILKITSTRDGYYQTLNATTVQQWRNSSAYFNGDMVLVEIIAYPGTGNNRIVVDRADVGLIPQPTETICGTDNRELSNDPAAARLMPIGCTGWIIDDACGCMNTAGHCVGGSNVIQFNVPLSNGNGSLNNPPPQHQYAVDASSKQGIGAGIGNDWGYLGAFPNSNTGLTPRQAQGAQFTFSSPPPFNPNQQIRITGYGVDSTPSSHNQVQQTSAGPWVTFTGTTLQYRTDTEGGNSGSPVIHEATGNAIGIHTHGGCNSGGGGQNSGTAGSHPGLQNALANPRGVCLKLVCPPPSVTVNNGIGVNPLCFSAQNQPILGMTWNTRVDATGVPGAQWSIVMARLSGGSRILDNGGELLLNLSSTQIFSSFQAGGGVTNHAYAIPDNPSLGGQTWVVQGLVGSGESVLRLCNALNVTIGCE